MTWNSGSNKHTRCHAGTMCINITLTVSNRYVWISQLKTALDLKVKLVNSSMIVRPREPKSQCFSVSCCCLSYLRKLQASSGERQWSTHVGRLKMEQRLGSRAVGPPPLIITILWICSGYSWARNVQNDTLGKQNKIIVTGQAGKIGVILMFVLW